MSDLKAEETIIPDHKDEEIPTSNITTEDVDAFFVGLAAKEAQDASPTPRVQGNLTVNVNHGNLYFYVDHIRGLTSALGRGGSGHFRGTEIPSNLGSGGLFRLTLTHANATLWLWNNSNIHIHTYNGTVSVSGGLVGTWEGRWS